jgi:hypothetical protein
MPVFVLAFGLAFIFFMFVIPPKAGLLSKVIISIGLAAAANLVFAIFAPEWAMTVLGGE